MSERMTFQAMSDQNRESWKKKSERFGDIKESEYGQLVILEKCAELINFLGRYFKGIRC